MPTLSAAKQSIGYMAAGYLVPLRADFETAGLDGTALADDVLFLGAISFGLSSCGVDIVDPTAPDQSDLDGLVATDWQKFLAFAGLYVLEVCVGASITIPDVIQTGGAEVRTEWDRVAIQKLLDYKRAVINKSYPGILDSTLPLTAGWLSIEKAIDSEY